MKKTKKNNKGFSLVELIVVVLILGILAVAVTPQVMKWVGKSKISGDQDTANGLKSAVQTALADWQGEGNKIPTSGDKFKATFNNNTMTVNKEWTGTVGKLSDKIAEVTAGDYPKSQYDTAGFVVEVDTTTGKITMTFGAKNKTE